MSYKVVCHKGLLHKGILTMGFTQFCNAWVCLFVFTL